ncbi:MAG: GntR family transcriptional regulator [Gemmatimonadetes bacterium]|jgi:DNA-binding GntR family transcriptional regulator|nr:GntR family transcriptional regulator [Gemmatimonadota bacterium]
MMLTQNRLSGLPEIANTDMSLEHRLLKDRAADTLRDCISSGKIPEGTKLTERDISELLGISRAPARDALMILETEGLVVSKPGGRFVIELTEKDVRDIHMLRWTLERVAAELAAANVTDANREELYAALRNLEAAVDGDAHDWARCDTALHRTIWRLADNAYLLKILDSVLGAIFVLAERDKMYGTRDSERDIANHRELVDLIAAGDGVKAGQVVELQVKQSLEKTLKTFRLPEIADTPDARGQLPG